MKKLRLNKEKIANLSNQEASSIQGGRTAHSTNNGFTCCWCATGDTGNATIGTECCSTREETREHLCPPGE